MAQRRRYSEFDPKVHKRVLRFVNGARTPEELMQLDPNFFAEVLSPGAPSYMTLPLENPVPLFDQETAEQVIRERVRISPIYGFSHFGQIEEFLTVEILERLVPVLMRHFSGATYGEWTK